MTYHQLKKTVEDKGYTFFDNGDFNLNIIAFRSQESRTNLKGYCDKIYVAFKENGIRKLYFFKCTTLPRKHWLIFKNWLNKKGTAILVPGQYRSAWTFEEKGHRGKPALRQAKNITIKRDNKDDAYVKGFKKFFGWFGINIHWASRNSIFSSAGCQVLELKYEDYQEEFIDSLVRPAVKIHGKSFTYTLIEN